MPSTARHRDDESGAVAIMAAALVLAMLVATSLAVDVGRAAFVSRDQQGVTDRGALDAMTVVIGGGAPDLAQLYIAVRDEIAQSLGRNPGTDGGTARDRQVDLIALGYVEDAEFLAVCDDDGLSPAPDCAVASDPVIKVTAVRLVTESFVPFVFAIGDPEGGRTVIREAVAEGVALGQVKVGSELAGLDEGLLNDMLETILCSDYEATTEADVDANGNAITGSSGTRVEGLGPNCSLGVSLVGYEGLAAATVTLGQLVEELSLGAGSPNEVLDTDVTVADLLRASIAALDDEGSAADIALNELAADIDQTLTVNLLDMMHVETGTVGQAAAMELNVLDLVQSSAQLVNGTNLLTLPATSVVVPGVADVTAGMTVIEAPQKSAYGPPGVRATTSQVDLGLDTELTLDLASTVLGFLSTLSLGTLNVTADPVVLPVDVDVAAAEAVLDSITCGDPANVDQTDTFSDVTTSTDVVNLAIGDGSGWVEVSRVRVKVTGLLALVLADATLHVQVRATAALGGATDDTNTFNGPYESGPEHTAGGVVDFTDLAATGLEVRVVESGYLGVLGTLTGDLSSEISGAVTPAALTAIGGLDDAVVQPALDQLGVGLGNADTWVTQVHCRDRRLAWIDPAP